MHNKLFFMINLLFCIGISIFMAFFISHNQFFQFDQKSAAYQKTETFFKKDKSKDIVKIKEKIEERNHPKEEIPEIPSQPMTPRDYFSQNNILMIGDSLVEGMEAYGALYSSNTLWQRGKRIDNMDDQLEGAIAFQPNILVLSYGLNDIQLWNGNVDRFIDAYRDSLNAIKNALPNTKIYVCSILPVSTQALNEDTSFQFVTLFNTHLQQLCSEMKVTFVDSSYILNSVSDPYSPDGIHPKGFFYEEWANNLMNRMEE